MKANQTLFGTLGAVIALIAFLAMPSIAEAHAGHAHTRPAATSLDFAPITMDAPEVQSPSSPASKHEVSAANPTEQRPRPCTGVICCGKTVCAGCVSVILHDIATPQPPPSRAEPIVLPMKATFGLGPLQLKRPPRTFA